MHIRDVMKTDVVTVEPDDTVKQVADKIIQHQIGAVFVVSDDRLLGKISRQDLLEHVFPTQEEFYDDLVRNIDFEEIMHRAQELAEGSARDLMQPVTLTVDPDTHVMKVAAWMTLRGVHRVAVIDTDGRLCGVVSQGDIFDQTMSQEMATPARTSRSRDKKAAAKAAVR